MTRQATKPNIRLYAALLLLIAVFALSRRFSAIQGQPAQSGNVPLLANGDQSKGDPARAQELGDGDGIQPTTSVARARRPAITDLVPVQTPASAEWTVDEKFHRDGVIVMGRLKSEDVRWVMKDLPEWQHAIYTVDDPHAPLRVKKNKGREANVYLQYIIDHYHKLPETIIFLHSHRDGIKGWHTEFFDHSNVETVRKLNSTLCSAAATSICAATGTPAVRMKCSRFASRETKVAMQSMRFLTLGITFSTGRKFPRSLRFRVALSLWCRGNRFSSVR